MSKQVYQGKSVEEALAAAAAELGVAVADLGHEVVEEKTEDFWGLGETVYHVRAWVPGSEQEPEQKPESAAAAAEPVAVKEAPRQKPAAAADPPAFFAVASPEPVPTEMTRAAAPAAKAESSPTGQTDAAPKSPPMDGDQDIAAAAVALLGRIFETMGFDCTAEAQIDGGTLQVSISGEDNQYLLDGRGRGLSALELILNHAFRHRPDVGQKKIRVDAGDFRSQRDDEIRDLAYQVAHRAKETGEAQQTEPMNPYERRIVHLTLAEDPQVTTRSQGAGFLKAVSVIPKPDRR